MGLWDNVQKWDILRQFCDARGLGMLVTDGRLPLRTLIERKVALSVTEGLLTALRAGPLSWPEYDQVRRQVGINTDDFLSRVWQRSLRWRLQPFRLELPVV